LPATKQQPPRPTRPTIDFDDGLRARARGCLLGGAVGDALGAPVEFMSRAEIVARFGPGGIRDYVPAYGRVGAITDDTQMTLFSAEGLMRAYLRAVGKGICHAPGVFGYAYLRWLHTQGISHPKHETCLDGWLITHPELHARRAPGRTCVAALRAMESTGTPARNDSKGCGGVMRVAPMGVYPMGGGGDSRGLLQESFRHAVDAAALTHGHPTGQVAAGAFAAIVRGVMNKNSLSEAIDRSLAVIRSSQLDFAETERAIVNARNLAASDPANPEATERLGGGWVAEEALAIGLYAALSAKDFESGVVLAVNHGGDSDSTGSIAGNLLGALHGSAAIPARWLDPLELRGVIEEMADDLVTMDSWKVNDDDKDADYRVTRYPGW
jgi:ADP-ribosyl-[dinitrogen reductase] hydrolase